jgi:hypothetical protein
MPSRTHVVAEVQPATTPVLAATFLDQAGNPITTLTTLRMTLYDALDGQIVNGRDQSDVSSAFSAGVLSLTLSSADTALRHKDLDREVRVALFEWTWGASQAGKHEISWSLINLRHG